QLAPLTGARSNIIHEQGARVRGRITFYSEPNLLAVLDAYRAELLKTMGQADTPIAVPYESLEDFQRRPLPPEAFQVAQPARYEALLRLMKKYKLLLSHGRSYVGRAPLEDVPEGEIARYVTQNAAGQGRDNYLYLAVEKVEIWCQFPHKNVGRITLIDMPGLGEVTLGGPERMLEALRLDADVALFIWRVMPNDTLHEGESLVSLYDTCYRAMEHTLPLDQWSFLVLNHDRTRDNMKECEEALQKVREPGSAFRFFAESICDCSSPEEVGEHVLTQVLAHLAERMAELDRRVASAFAAGIEELARDASAALAKALTLFGGSAEGLDEREFEKLFEQRWESLRRGLNNLVEELRGKVEAPDDSFVQQVKETLDLCRRRHSAPGEEEARRQLQADTAYYRVLETQRIWMRAQLSQSLRELDTALDQPLAAVKARVAEVLGAEGGFGLITSGGGLGKFSERLISHSTGLREAVEHLVNFRMSARGIIGYKIRVKLQALEPARELLKPQQSVREEAETEVLEVPDAPGTPEAKPKSIRFRQRPDRHTEAHTARLQDDARSLLPPGTGGAQIHDQLSMLFQETLAEIEAVLDEDLARPNQVAYAIVADFVDSVVHARDSESEWRNVYRNLRQVVWPTDYELQRRRQQKRQTWQASLESVSELIRRGNISLPTHGASAAADE
ncbi:MAG TPA: hypothetical protein VGA87_07530, partial [Pyrinomonadaceae bacterium]